MEAEEEFENLLGHHTEYAQAIRIERIWDIRSPRS
jgi:hypothetical protein